MKPIVHGIERFTGWPPAAMTRAVLVTYFVAVTVDTWGPHGSSTTPGDRWWWYPIILMAVVAEYRRTFRAERLAAARVKEMSFFRWPATVRAFLPLIIALAMPGVLTTPMTASHVRVMTLPMLVYLVEVDPKNPAKSVLREWCDALMNLGRRPVPVEVEG